MTEINEEILEGLAAKLGSLELSDAERALLDGVLSRVEAFEPEVAGFGRSFAYTGLASGANLSPLGFSLGRSGGMLGGASRMTESMTEMKGMGYRTEA